ncbi:MAG: PP2C family protein-serine/threonine phosphatase [Anaerolineales bacterium]
MPKNTQIRLVIAAGHALVRAGLASYIHSLEELQLIGEAENGDDVLQLCEMQQPDVALLDVDLRGVNGMLAASIIRQRWPKITVVLLLNNADENLIQAANKAGAAGCLTKNITPQDLLTALQNFHDHLPISASGSELQAVQPARKSQPRAAGLRDAKPGTGQLSSHHMQIELEMAGRIQNKILPEKPPALPGWDIAATLEPAYETSGDFYDFIPLAYGKMGIVIGDVANKGLGAAIFMALCNSLMRTYATHFPIMPGMMINAVNERLNADTRSNMFVTSFYGVLDPKLNRLLYVNAGHNPPIIVSSHKGKPVDQLKPTGPALGIFETTSWTQKMVKFSPGDVLLMYTDGVTEAQNAGGDFFDESRLLHTLRTHKDDPAVKIQQAVLRAVNRFTGGGPREDDIALIVIRRQA